MARHNSMKSLFTDFMYTHVYGLRVNHKEIVIYPKKKTEIVFVAKIRRRRCVFFAACVVVDVME